ncbi:MAG: F0F1 ATP synthase subunit epsilon [Clostridia bacterium]|jgi:F-type H+-transporting ATPase subunit epsilon|nr:F0F1 ATP synthase subunit epsilon [Clostridia bacterium]MDD4146310.1 F0F1 ATP synthase subunit epsilon [Clostridia bacterium]MDD4665827.1 F0F1 ATP synthase subunit epsilon [Clostridia bacterium]
MANVLNFEVITPERIMLKGKTTSLIVPATEGFLGVWPNHAPLITGLQPGIVKYRQGETFFVLAISNGFMEVADNVITILVNTAERPEDIDVARAQAAKERAEKRLYKQPPGLDVHRAEFALHRALARLKAVHYKCISK